MTKPPEASSPGLPPIDFWEDRLEIRADPIAAYRSQSEIELWLNNRARTEVAVLRALVGLPTDAKRRERRADLARYADELLRFVPVSVFGLYKSTLATVEVAEDCVSEQLRALAMNSDGTYDKSALLFAIYDHSLDKLEKVFFLDKLHRVGLARMKLRRTPRPPKRTLMEFLASEDLKKLLERFDRERRDRRRSQLRGAFERDGGCLVYIRRPHKEARLLIGDRLRHGHRADWIVLEFRGGGRFLNVASHGKKASFEIADRIASAFYGQPCEYINVEEVVYSAQLKAFLEQLAKGEAQELIMVAFGFREPLLPGLAVLEGSNPGSDSVGPAILELQRLLNVPLLDGDHLQHLKIVYREKRVPLRVDRLEGPGHDKGRRYVLRYRDQGLNLVERAKFEKLIEHNHGFKIVSTEKDRAKRRQARPLRPPAAARRALPRPGPRPE